MKVFISHSSSDKKFVKTLKDDLIENNIETWVDEDQLNFGDSLAEKLELALEQSSHFLIILSPTSVNSEWVQFELQKAIKQKDTQLLQKIIPVKYMDCEVPNELSSLLYADLSQEVRRVQGEKVFFISEGYQNFLTKLCKTLRNSERQLTATDKTAIKKGISKEINQESSSISHHIIKTSYKIIVFKDSETRNFFAKTIMKKTKDKSLKDINHIRPILLPPLLKNVLKNIDFGDKIYLSDNYVSYEVVHFAGFGKDDLGITIESSIVKAIGISKGYRYDVEINTAENRINFLLEE